MGHLVVLNLERGNWQQGFQSVIAQLWEADSSVPMQFTGSLPAAPELAELYAQWRSLYEALYSGLNWRQSSAAEDVLQGFLSPDGALPAALLARGIDGIEIDETDLTHVSDAEFINLCKQLRHQLNLWLDATGFRKIDQSLRTRLNPTDEVRLVIAAEDSTVLRLPWCLWNFLEDYPNAEIALSPLEYRRSFKAAVSKTAPKVRILAILGNQSGIDLAQDQHLLEQLPNAELHFLVEPSRKELNQQLWESKGWDILFFAGHSSSQNGGQIQLNQTDRIAIDQLKFGLKEAIAQGLKLAIFNSCDGLELAHNLADLHIPQVIVMREPIPDRVAQEFLKHFLIAFSAGEPLYRSVRIAREKLQALELEFPCATWLPVICQNPAEEPTSWQDWCNAASVTPSDPAVKALPKRRLFPGWRRLSKLAISSVIVTGVVLGGRWLGLLEPFELPMFDAFMRLRPHEEPDPRLLIVTADETDIQSQKEGAGRGSITDTTLRQLLKKLEAGGARVIGLDIYRDFAVSSTEPELAKRLQQSNRLIAVCKGRDIEEDPLGVSPPPEVPGSRLGFSDFVKDDDGVLRRQLLFMKPDPISFCTAPYAFSSQIAFSYLEAKGIAANFTPEGNLKLGSVVFPRLSRHVGGYHAIDTRGNQIMLNYRSLPAPDQIATQVTIRQVLSGQINPDALRDKVVLVGVNAASSGDYWATPYGESSNAEVAGVFLQAQMVSQMLSAVLDGRSLLWVWEPWQETLWIWGCSIVGGVLALYSRRGVLAIALVLATVALTGSCLVLMTHGGWVPLVPAGLTLVSTGFVTAFLVSKRQ